MNTATPSTDQVVKIAGTTNPAVMLRILDSLPADVKSSTSSEYRRLRPRGFKPAWFGAAASAYVLDPQRFAEAASGITGGAAVLALMEELHSAS